MWVNKRKRFYVSQNIFFIFRANLVVVAMLLSSTRLNTSHLTCFFLDITNHFLWYSQSKQVKGFANALWILSRKYEIGVTIFISRKTSLFYFFSWMVWFILVAHLNLLVAILQSYLISIGLASTNFPILLMSLSGLIGYFPYILCQEIVVNRSLPA